MGLMTERRKRKMSPLPDPNLFQETHLRGCEVGFPFWSECSISSRVKGKSVEAALL
jgi:hypothetical protein